MIPAIRELDFPKIGGRQYATLAAATVSIADMGEKTITTQVKIDGDIMPDFSRAWSVEYRGEKYIMPLRLPQGAKENTSLNSTIDLTFQHWAVWQLKSRMFFSVANLEAGTASPDEWVVPLRLNLGDFCKAFARVLGYWFGDSIKIDLNPQWRYDAEPSAIDISHTFCWDVLIKLYEIYAVRWQIVRGEDIDHYVIRVGYPSKEISHILQYGFEGGLMKVERQVQSDEIRNILLGRGGEKNLPQYYFKKSPDEDKWRSDPDWVKELSNIPFDRLRGATFRSYVQGWKAAHLGDKDNDGKPLYAGYTAVGEANAYAPWAYRKGYTDTKFLPVEFVADEIADNPASTDPTVEIMPGYFPAITRGCSIDTYGPRMGGLDNNDDIYPTIQGSGKDIAVDVEQVLTEDDAEEDAEAEATLSNIPDGNVNRCAENMAPGEYRDVLLPRFYFRVLDGKTANFIDNCRVLLVKPAGRPRSTGLDVAVNAEITNKVISIYQADNGMFRPASGLPAGRYYCDIHLTVHNRNDDSNLDITVGTETPQLQDAVLSGSERNTFSVWIEDVWDSTRLSGETDAQYAERVWTPVLGGREGQQAAVVFTSGALSISEDYEFAIVRTPQPDNTRTWVEKDASGNVVKTHTSHWRLLLRRSDAEVESTGKYVPNPQRNGAAGDHFVFVGTEMVHNYTLWAERRLDDYKKDALSDTKDIRPTWVVTTDRVRFSQKNIEDADARDFLLVESGGRLLGEDGGAFLLESSGLTSLIDLLEAGDTVRLADKRLIEPIGDRAYETLYLQSITYTYREPSKDDAALNPDVELVLGTEYATSANPVSTLQGEVTALQRQVGSISNVQQIVRAVGDRLYLRKDGIEDISLSPTRFFAQVCSGNFRGGIIGGAGWGLYRDANGDWVLETDRINVRKEFQANTLVINQAKARGGMEVDTAAFMEVTRVDERDDRYICYFDRKDGTVANLFQLHDVAYCQHWDPKNNALKYYKRRVVAVTEDSVALTKALDAASRPAGWPDSGVNGSGAPEVRDVIIHFGNYVDEERRFVKVRDVVGGGYECFLDGLDSVNADGVEYYFAGRRDGDKPRWFVGNANGAYMEFYNNRLLLNGVELSITSKIGDKTIGAYIDDKVNDMGNFAIDLDSDTVPVPCNSLGAVEPTFVYPAIQATVYRNGNALTSGVTYSIASYKGLLTAPTISAAGVISFSGVNLNSASITVEATIGSATLSATVSIFKVIPGVDGKSAVLYRLQPDVRQIVKDLTGELARTEVICAVYRTTGDSTPVLTADKTLKYQRIGLDSAETVIAHPGGYSGAVQVDSRVQSVVFSLYDGETLLDRESVPILSDASDLEIGGRNLIESSGVVITESNYLIKNFRTTENMVPGRTYTMTIWGQPAADKQFGLFGSHGGALLSAAMPRVAEGVYRATFVWPTLADGAYNSISVFNMPSMVVGTSVINRVKLEQGNVGTDWTPAPEDAQSEIDKYQYLSDAMLNGATTTQGGLQMTQALLLGEWATENGSPVMTKVYAGMNGKYVSPRTLASWWGGDMIDRSSSESEDAANAAVRMDGTGYFAGNTVRFEDKQMWVGDNVLLDDDGLSLIKDGKECFRVTSREIPASIIDAASQPSEQISLSTSTTVNYLHRSGAVSSGLVSQPTALLYSMQQQTSLAREVPDGSTITAKASLALTLPGITVVEGSMRVDLIKNGSTIGMWTAGFRPSADDKFIAEFNLSQPVEAGSYSIRISIVRAATSGGSSTQANASIVGTATKGVANKTLQGSNGLVSVWGSTLLFAGSEGVVMKHGNFGLKITSEGIQKWSGGAWVASGL